jgi:hypothetical protein
VGWAADQDTPTSPIDVRISVDGAGRTFHANVTRPDIASTHPSLGAIHGYDVTLPATHSRHTICVTAVNVGTGTDASLGCRTEDEVDGFTAFGFTYDTPHAVVTSTVLDELDRVVNVNRTAVTQNTEMDSSKAVTDTRGWSDTEGVKVTLGSAVDVGAVFVKGTLNVTVEGSASFTQNGSESTVTTFSWKQPVIVPPKSQVTADIAVSRSTVTVPYAMNGVFTYPSGATVAGSVTGTYHGISSHDLNITMQQEDLNGVPAARPVRQPAARALRTLHRR